MRSLKRTIIVRYALGLVIIAMMVAFALTFTINARLPEAIAVMVGLGLLLVGLGVVTILTQRTLVRDLRELGAGLRTIVAGSELDRMPQPRFREMAELAHDIDTIGHAARETIRLLERERDSLEAVLENTPVGIIVVGPDLRTGMINPAAERLLGTSKRYALGRTFTEIHHSPAIDCAIEEAGAGEEHSDEVSISLPRRRTLKVLASPIAGEEGATSGVVCILEDITARRRLERVRSDFVANVSHELRTPVSNMRAVVEALGAGAVSEPETAGRFMKDLDRESSRLAQIIEDLLVLSRLEEPKCRAAARGSFDVLELLEEVAGEKSALASDCSVEVSTVTVGGRIPVEGDRKLIKTACSNLLDNAIKYNVPGGKVELKADLSEDEVAIVVSDTGIGIPFDERSKVFERFYRIDKARSRETGGTGLGLSIVKHAAEYHGGRVHMESSIGKGSSFFLVLPAGPGRRPDRSDQSDPS